MKKGKIDFNKNICEELSNGNYKKYPIFPIFIKRNGWIITYQFIDLTGKSAQQQKLEMLTLNSHFQGAIYSVKRKIEKENIDYKKELGLRKTDNELMTYQALASLEKPDLRKRSKGFEGLLIKLFRDSELLTERFELSNRYIFSIMTYLLTGLWCTTTGVVAEVDEIGEINIRISENVSLADIKKHWKFIVQMKGMLIPEFVGQKPYNYLKRDSDIYYSSKWTHETTKEIGERYNLDETTTRKIVSRVKKRARDI